MRRVELPERPDWRARCEQIGFDWHTMYGAAYWTESYAYALSEAEIDRLDDATAELYGLCMRAVDVACDTPGLLDKLQIPAALHDLVRQSWREGDKDLYGRFDLRFEADQIKLYEFNADTPTGLYESSVVQWLWLEEQRQAGLLPAASDQFNSLHERLCDALPVLAGNKTLYMASAHAAREDEGTVDYLIDCAQQAGIRTVKLDAADIGICAENWLRDARDGQLIQRLFKLIPWETMARSTMAPALLNSGRFLIEPAWKMILSNKGLLPLLWELFPGHDLLLAASWERPAGDAAAYVEKPIFSREGQNIRIYSTDGALIQDTGGEYGAERTIFQEYAPPPKFETGYVVIGSWIVAGQPAGICLREDDGIVTFNLSRFVPHYFVKESDNA